jgi:hypothetical protein
MGALYLTLIYERMEATGLTSPRFMDDWVVLAPTHWKLRAAIRLVNETLAELKLQQRRDKTFIGRISRGFDLLGYLFTPAGLEVAPRALERCVERVSRLNVMSKVWTWTVSEHTFGAGNAGPGAASGRCVRIWTLPRWIAFAGHLAAPDCPS